MSKEEIKSEDKIWHNIIISKGLIEATFISLGMWMVFYQFGILLFISMEGAMSMPPGVNNVYGFLENHLRHAALTFLLFISTGLLFPLISYATYKRNHSLFLVLISGTIIGALIFTFGTMNFPDLNHLNSIIFRLIYGAALGLGASLVGNLFFLFSFLERGIE